MSIYDHLEFRHLKYIIAIAEEGTFTAAATRLHVAQSALSTQIRALEDILQIRIFERDRGVTLTAEGEVLLTFARETLQARADVIETLRAIRLGILMPLRLGFSPFVQKGLLGSVSEIYKALLPNCEIAPESGDTDELTKRVRQNILDAAIVTLPVSGDDLQIEILERERLVVCMRNDDPLAAFEFIPPSALNEKLSIFTYQGHHPAAYDRMLEMLEEFNVSLRPCKPTMNIDHIQWMVKEGVCYSLMRADQPLLIGLITRPIASVEWTIDSAMILRIGNKHPALSLLILELRKHFHRPAETAMKKPAVAIKIHGKPRTKTSTSSGSQFKLFSSEDEDGQRDHLQKGSRHHKEVLDG